MPKTSDETKVCELTINHCLLEVTSILLDSSGLVAPSVVMPFSAVQKSGIHYSRSKSKHTVMNIPLLHLEAHLSSFFHTHANYTAQKCLQSVSQKSRLLGHSAA